MNFGPISLLYVIYAYVCMPKVCIGFDNLDSRFFINPLFWGVGGGGGVSRVSHDV